MKDTNDPQQAEKMSEKQKRALTALEKTLREMDSDKFWARVMKLWGPKCDALDEARRKSLEKAGTKALR